LIEVQYRETPKFYECYWAHFAAEIHMSEFSANRRLRADYTPQVTRTVWALYGNLPEA